MEIAKENNKTHVPWKENIELEKKRQRNCKKICDSK
jgi:hypothetical protein